MSLPKAFVAIDLGSATTSAALIGHAAGRWRLIAHRSAPSGVDADRLVADLVRRVGSSDSSLLAELQIDADASGSIVRIEARSSPPRRIAVLAVSRKQRQRLEASARKAGWLVSGASVEEADLLALARLALSRDVQALLLGADGSPGRGERRRLSDLAALAAAVRRLRPELTVVLAGGAAIHESIFAAPEDARAAQLPGRSGAVISRVADADSSLPTPQPVVVAPDHRGSQSSGSSLQGVLEGLRVLPDDSRLGIARSAASLGRVLGRSVEVIEVGARAGLRVRTWPTGPTGFGPIPPHACLTDAAPAPGDLSEEVLDSVVAWSTEPVDRHRLADRLRELDLAPWGDGDGDGATFRLAAAKGAISRLVDGSPELGESPAPELLVAAGGILASSPPAAVALALADAVRPPGVTVLACDQARLLGPLGALTDEEERQRLLSDLAEDLLLPLGSLVLPTGIRPGRSVGRLRLVSGAADTEIDLRPGTVQVVDLPPGQSGRISADFRDNVRLGSRGRHFELDVAGGLCGVIVDLRDVPLRSEGPPETRRAAREALQRAAWPELDR